MGRAIRLSWAIKTQKPRFDFNMPYCTITNNLCHSFFAAKVVARAMTFVVRAFANRLRC